MHIDLNGRVAVVTGGGRGIGRDLIRRLASEGVVTVALDVNEGDLETLRAELSALPVESAQYVCDITDADAVRRTVDEVVERFSTIDVLINNAGVSATGNIDELDEAAWRRCFDVNVTGVFQMCKAIVPVMKQRGGGRIINAASFAAIVPSVGHAAYAASKAAVVQLTRALAGEVGPWNITVNAYAPGMIPTSLNNFDRLPQQRQDVLLDTLTLRRWGSTDNIGDLVCFLASDAASYITGTMVDISGGKLATQVPRIAYDYANDQTTRL